MLAIKTATVHIGLKKKIFDAGIRLLTSVIPRLLNFASSLRKSLKNVDSWGQLING